MSENQDRPVRWRTDRDIANLPIPTNRANVRYPHATVKRLFCTVTKAGARSPCMKYGNALFTFGTFPSWTAREAEAEGKRLNVLIDRGGDPAAERKAKQQAPIVHDLCTRLAAEHFPSLRPSTRKEYARILDRHVRPWWGRLKVAEVAEKDVRAKLRELAGERPYMANRVRSVLSLVFKLAVKEALRHDDPSAAIKPAHEDRRENYLDPEQIARLVAALQAHPEKISASAILVLLLTGCRLAEALNARWSEFDLDRAVWVKPSTRTKQKRQHRIPLSSAAVAVLREMQAENERLRSEGAITPYVFPSSKRPGQPLTTIAWTWRTCRDQAGLKGFRVHDLRHSFASVLVSNGLSLPTIGALLGHSQPAVTARYAHLFDSNLRDAAERMGAVVAPAGRRS
jgi:integrase